MPQSKPASGCRKMLRRTFLFLIVFAGTQVLAEYFSVPKNRDNFFTLMGELWQKLLALIAKYQSDQTSEPLPNTPVAKTTPATKPTVTNYQSPELKVPNQKGKPVEISRKTIAGVRFYQTIIDLTYPETFITIGLANNADIANNHVITKGDESFKNLVARQQAAIVTNGTFFGKDNQKAVLGNMVAGGKFVKYSRWENYGTTLGIKAGNELEMVTARTERKPDWTEHWFSLTCGPRLVKEGKVSLSPLSEGFKDSHVLGVGARCAIGFPESRKQLYLVTFLSSLSLQKEAEIMQAIGCVEAMNLDGGASLGLAHKGKILVSPGRNLTNVIAVYDTSYPAPEELKMSWLRFQNGDRPSPATADFSD
ncbi:MAG: phosphodiester glycosidase family protein [Phormidium sp.]